VTAAKAAGKNFGKSKGKLLRSKRRCPETGTSPFPVPFGRPTLTERRAEPVEPDSGARYADAVSETRIVLSYAESAVAPLARIVGDLDHEGPYGIEAALFHGWQGPEDCGREHDRHWKRWRATCAAWSRVTGKAVRHERRTTAGSTAGGPSEDAGGVSNPWKGTAELIVTPCVA
jgi:hypothetical protein